MVITIMELKKIFDSIMKKLQEEAIEKIVVDNKDNYWQITSPEWTDFNIVPEPEVGSFIDDWDSLKKLLSGENPTTYVDFDRTASILHLLSEKLNPVKK